MRRRDLWLLVTLAGALGATGPYAGAEPSVAGKIAFLSNRDGPPQIYGMNAGP